MRRNAKSEGGSAERTRDLENLLPHSFIPGLGALPRSRAAERFVACNIATNCVQSCNFIDEALASVGEL